MGYRPFAIKSWPAIRPPFPGRPAIIAISAGMSSPAAWPMRCLEAAARSATGPATAPTSSNSASKQTARASPRQPPKEKEHGEDDEHEEYDSGRLHGDGGNAAETEQGRDQGDYQKY